MQYTKPWDLITDERAEILSEDRNARIAIVDLTREPYVQILLAPEAVLHFLGTHRPSSKERRRTLGVGIQIASLILRERGWAIPDPLPIDPSGPSGRVTWDRSIAS